MQPTADRLREAIVHAAEMLFAAGVMQHGGHGNLSARLPGGQMVLTRKGHIRTLAGTDFVVADMDGRILAGEIEPANAEIIPMHAAIYRMRDHVGAIIHTHSPHVTAFALAHEPLPVVYEGLLRFGIEDPIPVAGWAPRGSEESVGHILRQLEQHARTPAVLLANHGLLAFGPDPTHAAELIVSMEEAAEMTLNARALGGEKPFPPGALAREQQRIREFETRSRRE